MRIPLLGVYVSRRALLLVLVAFLAFRLYRRGPRGVLPSFTFRQRTEP